MDEQEKKRVRLVNALHARKSTVEFLTVFKYKKKTVYRLKKKYDDFLKTSFLLREKFTRRTRATRLSS